MTKECEQLLAAALKSVGLGGSFNPSEIGAKVGLNRAQAELAARSLSNAGVLDLGFDLAANFTIGYRKVRAAQKNRENPGTTEKSRDKSTERPAKSSKSSAKRKKAVAV